MYTSDIQILKLPDILKQDGLISGPGEFYEKTGITPSHFSNVKNQKNYGRAFHFSPAQIEDVCKAFKINFNWVFDASKEVYQNTKKAQITQKID